MDEQKRIRAMNIACIYHSDLAVASMGEILTLEDKRVILEQSTLAYDRMMAEKQAKKQANIDHHLLHNANQKANAVAENDGLSKSQRRRRRRKPKK